MFPSATTERFSEVLDLLAAAASGLTDSELGLPSPCEGWSIGETCFHVLVALDLFAQLPGAGEWDLDSLEYPSVATEAEVESAFAEGSTKALRSWRRPDALTRSCTLPFGQMHGAQALAIHSTDLLIHAWDISAGRGVDLRLDDDLAHFGHAVALELITPDLRGDGLAFGSELPVEPDADPTARLLAFVGRRAPNART